MKNVYVKRAEDHALDLLEGLKMMVAVVEGFDLKAVARRLEERRHAADGDREHDLERAICDEDAAGSGGSIG